jgi:D-lactate dehydrogenase
MKIVTSSSCRDEAFSASLNIKHVSFDEAISHADIVTLHVPYTPKTHHIMDEVAFKKMKKGSYIINTARGGIVDTQALFNAIESNHLGGAGIDVFEQEEQLMEELSVLSGLRPRGYDYKTLLLDHLLVRHHNVIVTPHNAFNSNEALQNIIDVTEQNLLSFDKGTPINIVTSR